LLESEVGGQISNYKNGGDEEFQCHGDVELNAQEKSQKLLTEDLPTDQEMVTSKKCCGKWDLIEEKDFENISDSRERKLKILVIIFGVILLCAILVPSVLIVLKAYLQISNHKP